jgi:hypothetical protein
MNRYPTNTMLTNTKAINAKVKIMGSSNAQEPKAPPASKTAEASFDQKSAAAMLWCRVMGGKSTAQSIAVNNGMKVKRGGRPGWSPGPLCKQASPPVAAGRSLQQRTDNGYLGVGADVGCEMVVH